MILYDFGHIDMLSWTGFHDSWQLILDDDDDRDEYGEHRFRKGNRDAEPRRSPSSINTMKIPKLPLIASIKNCKMADSKASVSVLGIFTEENYMS